MKQTHAWAGAGGVLLVFGALGFQVPRWLNLSGWWYRGTLALLILLAIALAVLALMFLRARARAAKEAEGPANEDIDQTFAAAEARLAASGSTQESRIARLPLAVVIGPTGSTKTSVLTHSGLDPELLAGEVMRSDAVVPTDPVNVFYAHGSILVEAGGALLDDAQRWRRVVHHLRPSRLAAAFGRGRQAPRVAIVCIGCDEFHKPGASQGLASIARQIRARLAEASQQLGIRLPVYVLFTRADRLQPYFADYVRSFTNDEAQQVLGATLPLAENAGGSWAERESRRLNDAFARIVRALAARRLDLLSRESEESVRASAYEFPRELRKIAEPAVQLLLDIFRPSQLGVNPFLRGFYFTGVRPIILRDVVAESAAPSQPGTAAAFDAGATSVFNPAMLRQMPQHVPVISASGRKVPQWVFLKRLFQEVLLRDDVALRITGGGTRVDMLRRGLIGSVAAAGIILALGFSVSWGTNRGMIRSSTEIAQKAQSVDSGIEKEDLATLDTLRQQTAKLRDGGPWLWSGWWLNRSDTARALLRGLYFDRFEVALWAQTRDALTSHLVNLKDKPDESSNYTLAHDALAAYLLTTRQDTLTEPELLRDALTHFWAGQAASDTVRELAQLQFHFFGEELPLGNPYSPTYDDALVKKGQLFIREFGPDAYFSALIADVNRDVPPIQWSEQSMVRNTVPVGGAFTLQGWSQVESRLETIETFIEQRAWLYGDQGPLQKPNPDSLKRRYEEMYVAAWQGYLGGARVAAFGSANEGSARLTQLGSPSSPLFRMLHVASQHTSVRSLPAVSRAFAPLHAAVPSEPAMGPASRVPGYTNLLSSLGTQLTTVTTPGANDEMVRTVALQLSNEVGTIAVIDSPNARADETRDLIQRLLRQPVELTNAVLSQLGPAAVNQAGASFCEAYASVGSRFPLRRGAPDAEVGAVTNMFRKDGGDVATFRDVTLEPYVTSTGQRKGGTYRVTDGVLTFLRRATDFADAISTPTGLAVRFDFRPIAYPEGVTEVILVVQDARTPFTRNDLTRRYFEWRPDQHTTARLVVRAGTREEVVAEPPPGPWSIFKLFQQGEWTTESAGRYTVRWNVQGFSPALEASVGFADNRPVLHPDYLSPLARCPRPILN